LDAHVEGEVVLGDGGFGVAEEGVG
jgi:hypothetical protein